MHDYRQINTEVMTNTQTIYRTLPELKEAIGNSIARQFMVAHDDAVVIYRSKQIITRILVTGNRTLHAARAYHGKKVAVLNFANNHSIGGSPFLAGAQEEALCRCSTLWPCLKAMKECYYDKHSRMYQLGQIDHMGNDDIIYTPDVVVFKTDELTDPIYPQMMKQKDWYKVDVITSAAPELWDNQPMPNDYEAQIYQRIKKILDVAESQGVEVLILGAWGCGAFRNPINVVAPAFMQQLAGRSFEAVEFALSDGGDLINNRFALALGYQGNPILQ